MLEEMIQRCPQCGQWVKVDRSGLVSRAVGGWCDAVEGSAETASSFLGEKVGSVLGGAFGGYLGLANGYFEAVAGDKYRFECPECGAKWSTSDEEDDQSEEYATWLSEEEQIEELMDEWRNAESTENYLTLGQKIQDTYNTFGQDKEHIAKLCDMLALCQYFLGDYDECISTIEFSQKLIPYYEGDGIIGLAMSQKDKIYAEDAYNSMVNLSSLLCSNSSPYYLTVESYEEAFDRMKNVYCQLFNEIPFERRKYIVVVDEISLCKEDVLPIRQRDIPSDFIFQGGRPIQGVLYVANPVKPNIYYRAEDYELSTFRDQLDDFLLVLSSLGAKKLSFHDTRTSEKTYDGKNSVDVNGNGSFNAYSGSVGVHVNKHTNAYQKLCNDYFREMEFCISQNNPSRPSTPWFKEMSDWQALAHQRLDLGTAVKDHRRIALSESATLQEETKVKVEAEYKAIQASLGVDVHTERSSVFSENYDLCWEYDVEFYHLNEYENRNLKGSQSTMNSRLSNVENEYLEEVNALLEDGEIGPRERRSLDRLQLKLGIKLERAKEIESMAQVSSFNDVEKEYLEEVRFVLEDGEIGARERKTLDRLRNKLGISLSRSAEIESFVKSSL